MVYTKIIQRCKKVRVKPDFLAVLSPRISDIIPLHNSSHIVIDQSVSTKPISYGK